MEAGAGITLWSRAIAVLEGLGLGDALHARSEAISGSRLCRPDGEAFPDTWLGTFVASDSLIPPICVHRVDLHQLLVDALGPDHIVYGARAIGVRPGSRTEPAVVRFADGAEVAADLTIGADGVRSAVRTALFADAAPAYNGQTIYRGVAPRPPSSAGQAPFVAIGEGTRFGWEPLPGDRVYWFAGRYQPEHEPDHPEGRQALLLEIFGDWAAPAGALIRSTPEDAIVRTDVYTVGPLDEWTTGRTALLGDAVHAIPPHVGHGACLAIEDADALADALASHNDLDTALDRYVAARRGRTAEIYDKAVQLGAGLRAGTLPTPA